MEYVIGPVMCYLMFALLIVERLGLTSVLCEQYKELSVGWKIVGHVLFSPMFLLNMTATFAFWLEHLWKE